MEGKKIDLNAPLLSVRVNRKIIEKSRPNRQHSLPVHKSDWDLTEVTKPAAVPFVWEQTPGRAKNGRKTQSQPPEEYSVTPRVPPGRSLDTVKRVSGEQFSDQTPSRPQVENSPMNENVKEESSSQSEDEAYSDALDTLSPAESFSWNCSVSGLSGYDGPNAKSSRTFTADPQTREFMMNRFLPAARAMVIEMPQHVSKKQPVVNEPPKLVKKVVSGELRPLLEKIGSNTSSLYAQYKGKAETEDENDDYDDCGRKSSKSCGLLPRICVKNSLSQLDTLPGMKSRAESPIPSAREGRRMARTAYSGPLPQPHEKHDWNDVYWKIIQSGGQSRELFENKLTGKPANHLHQFSDSFMTEGLSPHRRSRGGGISPYRNEKPQSPFHDGARFLGIPKVVKNIEADKLSLISKGSSKFRDVASQRTRKQGSDSVSTLVEKTLYIDSVNNVEEPNLDLVSSEAEGFTKSSEALVKSRGKEEYPTAKSFTERERLVKPKAFVSVKADPSPCISNLKGGPPKIEGLEHDKDLDQEWQSLHALVVHPNIDLVVKNENAMKVNNQGKPSVGSLESPRPPPLPKSPSESWLWHTLPSISLRNPFSHVQSKKLGQKTTTSSSKWETIVKTSHIRHDHARYSEELISHVSQHYKS